MGYWLKIGYLTLCGVYSICALRHTLSFANKQDLYPMLALMHRSCIFEIDVPPDHVDDVLLKGLERVSQEIALGGRSVELVWHRT